MFLLWMCIQANAATGEIKNAYTILEGNSFEI
jgi:hypothetical protein